jgi:hypothetical protein
MDFKHEISNECGHHIEKNGDSCLPNEIHEKIEESLDSIYIIKEKYNCDTEVCALNQPEVKKILGESIVDDIIENHFKPLGPRDNTNWFSNDDIDSVLSQISLKYKDKHFLHIPFQMRDFQTTNTELAKLHLPKKYKEGYRTFGTVFNTDTSRGSGEHWFAVFGCFEDASDEFTIEHFDSSGNLPSDEVQSWMKKVKYDWQPHFDKPIKDVVTTRLINQQDNWNCGSYSLYYIISRLDGTPYQYFKNNKIGDHNMQEFRKFLFRKSM